MPPASLNLSTSNKGDCAAKAWMLTGPGKPSDLLPVTEDTSVAAYTLISFQGFILSSTIAVHILCSLLMFKKLLNINSL